MTLERYHLHALAVFEDEYSSIHIGENIGTYNDKWELVIDFITVIDLLANLEVLEDKDLFEVINDYTERVVKELIQGKTMIKIAVTIKNENTDFEDKYLKLKELLEKNGIDINTLK